jgi:lipopolysaccharide transport system ATP-binding protein
MQMRLAFSVAAHLRSEILLIDEVLAVGDLEFQKKCLGKMEEVSKTQGRTILFVSHNMDSIRRFCASTILLENGKIIKKGSTEQVINEYIAFHLATKAEQLWQEGLDSYNGAVKLFRGFIHDKTRHIRSTFDTTEAIGITMEYEVLKDDTSFTHGINLYNQEHVNVFNSHDTRNAGVAIKRDRGIYRATAWIPGNLLTEGIFSVGLALFLPNPLDILVHAQEVLSFEIFTDFEKQNARGNYADDFPGIVRPLLDWESEMIKS